MISSKCILVGGKEKRMKALSTIQYSQVEFGSTMEIPIIECAFCSKVARIGKSPIIEINNRYRERLLSVLSSLTATEKGLENFASDDVRFCTGYTFYNYCHMHYKSLMPYCSIISISMHNIMSTRQQSPQTLRTVIRNNFRILRESINAWLVCKIISTFFPWKLFTPPKSFSHIEFCSHLMYEV